MLNLIINLKVFKIMQNKRLFIIVFIPVLILLIPLIVMQFTNEVNWNLMDFVIAGILLIGTGLIFDFAYRKIKNKKYLIAFCVGLLLLLFLIWAELAVGIFGSPLSES